jgi:hypothetical protein
MSPFGRLGPFHRTLWLLALLAALGWYGVFRVAQPLRGEPFTGALHGNDFKHLYLGAWMLTHGDAESGNPYDAEALQKMARRGGFESVNPYVYLPFTGLALSPLTLLSPGAALRCWFFLNHLFMIGAFVLMFRALHLAPNLCNLTAAAATVALCYPFHRTLTAGQLNCALLFLFALVFALEREGKPILAGAVAAFAFLFKLAPGILLPYFLWSAIQSRRDPQSGNPALSVPSSSLMSQASSLFSLVSMVLATVLLLGLSIAWVGVGHHLAFLPLLKQMSYGQSTWAQFGEAFYRDPHNQSLNSFFHHVLAPWPDMTPWVALGYGWANLLTRAAFLLCVVAVLWRTWPFRKSAPAQDAGAAGRPVVPESSPCSSQTCFRSDPAILYSLFILLSLLAPSIYWDHYAVIALLPLFACYARLAPPLRPWSTGLLVSLTLPLGGMLELTPLRGIVLCVAIAATLVGLARQGRRARVGVAWALAGVCLLARFPYGLAPFHHGLGLIPMSLVLWGSLVLFGLCLALASREENENSHSIAQEPA